MSPVQQWPASFIHLMEHKVPEKLDKATYSTAAETLLVYQPHPSRRTEKKWPTCFRPVGFQRGKQEDAADEVTDGPPALEGRRRLQHPLPGAPSEALWQQYLPAVVRDREIPEECFGIEVGCKPPWRTAVQPRPLSSTYFDAGSDSAGEQHLAGCKTRGPNSTASYVHGPQRCSQLCELTWHVFMDKEQGRSATHFVADKGSPGADETRVVGQGPPRLHCLLPTHQHSLRRSHLSHPRKDSGEAALSSAVHTPKAADGCSAACRSSKGNREWYCWTMSGSPNSSGRLSAWITSQAPLPAPLPYIGDALSGLGAATLAGLLEAACRPLAPLPLPLPPAAC
ncbi:MAG: hypothetical protein FRX49_10186 [Trebouxia sp. A1-2]|nr:MAG: hypothetical protein FRX49_10186 [Trebouxia sp. A1-2]